MPPQLTSYPAGESPNAKVDSELLENDLMLKELKEILGTSINLMKEQHDRKRREEEFQVGDWVYLKLRPYRQQSISQKALYKLGSRYYGPFQVTEHIGAIAYQLALSDDAQIHVVVHISQLKHRLGTGEVVNNRLPAVNQEGQVIYRLARVAEYHRIKRNGRFWWEVLVE